MKTQQSFFDTSDTYFPGIKYNPHLRIYSYNTWFVRTFVDLNSYQDEGSLEVENDEISTVEIADDPAESSQMGNYVVQCIF